MLLWMAMWMACAPEPELSLPSEEEGAFVPSGPPAPGPLPAVSLGVLADIQQETGVCWLVGQTGAGVAVDVLGQQSATLARLALIPHGDDSRPATSVFLENGSLHVTVDGRGRGAFMVEVDAWSGDIVRRWHMLPEELHKVNGHYVEADGQGAGYRRYAFWRGVFTSRDIWREVAFDAMVIGNGDVWAPATLGSASELSLFNVIDAQVQRVVPLEGFDSWVRDLQNTEQRLFVLDDGRSGWVGSWDQVLSVYDDQTGDYQMGYGFEGHVYTAFVCWGTN